MRNLICALLLFCSPALAAPAGQPDADMLRLLNAWSSLGGRPVEGLTATQARAQPTLPAAVDVVLRKLGRSTTPQSVAKVANLTVEGADGPLPARVYTPAGAGPFPMLVFFHGGGWVIGTIQDSDASARALANAAGCVVVTVGYRQAPEHPYPAAFKDAYAAYSYIWKNADLFDGDPRRVAVGGEGSGANLAAAVCLMAMEQRTKMPIHQLLICPIVSANFTTASYRRNANARPYSKAAMQWFFSQYLRRGSDAKSPYVSVIGKRATDVAGATVIVAELDPLCSEGEAYHEHLLANTVDSQLGRYSGVTADFFGTGAVVAKAKKAVTFAGGRLTKAFTLRRPRN